jgi:hypothetical protein
MVVDDYSAVVLKIEIELRHTLKMRQTARLFLIFRRRSDYAQNFSVGVAHGHGATRLLRQELCRGKRLFGMIEIEGDHRKPRRAASHDHELGDCHRGGCRPDELIHSFK